MKILRILSNGRRLISTVLFFMFTVYLCLNSFFLKNTAAEDTAELEILSDFENAIAKVVDRSTCGCQSFSRSKPKAPTIHAKDQQGGAGAGFIFHREGYLLTNAHVVEGAESFTVELFDDSRYEARLVGADTLTDIAVLKIERAEAFPALPIADTSDVRVGQFAIAIGHPINYRHTVTSGIVVGMALFSREYTLFQYHHNYIQTDA